MPMPGEIRQDLAYATRTLSREPGFVATVVLTFALAIGANAAMFGLLGRLLLTAPPGVSDPGRVGRVGLVFTRENGGSYIASSMSYPAFRALATLEGFTAVAAVRGDTLTVGRVGDLEDVSAVVASGKYFDVLGVRPHLGRFFSPADDQFPAGSPVAVLGYRYWQRRFSGDRAVLGREMFVEGRPYTIIGVAPRGFTGDELSPVGVFVPMTAAYQDRDPGWATNPGMNVVGIVTRRSNSIGLAAAQSAAAVAVRETFGDDRARSLTGVRLSSLLPGSSVMRENAQARTVLWLAGVAAVVLCVATANVGTLFLLRARRRRREIAVRVALGVGRARLASHLLTESLLLAFAGAAAGLMLQRWIADLISATLLPSVTLADTGLDVRMISVTLAAATVAGVIAGLVPLGQLGRRDVIAGLRDASDSGAVRRWTLRHMLVGVQVALCTVLLVGAGLFVRSLQKVQGQDLGFSTRRLMVLDVDFRGGLSPAERDAAHEEIARRLGTLPGITGATVVQAMPFGSHHTPPVNIPGRAEPPNVGGQIATMYGATPEYLRLMTVELREGRLFSAQDKAGSPPVVLINETFARGAWPGEQAIGKCILVGLYDDLPPGANAPATVPCREVVGIVRDSRVRSLRGEGNEGRLMQYYVPFGQLPAFPFGPGAQVFGLLVETQADPEAMIAPVQRLATGSTAYPVSVNARPYRELLDPQMRSWKLGATLFSVFGAMALGMAAVGLFGVISYLVNQRTHEIGVRLALGGTGSRVGRLVVTDAVKMAGSGVGVGLLAAVAAAPMIQEMLFQTSGRDVTVLLGVGAVLLAVTLLAAAVPAWRAGRVSPMEVLRRE